VHVSVARYFGFKPEGAQRTPAKSSQLVAEATAIAGPPRKQFVHPIPIQRH